MNFQSIQAKSKISMAIAAIIATCAFSGSAFAGPAKPNAAPPVSTPAAESSAAVEAVSSRSAPSASGNILEVAAQAGQFTTLVAAIEAAGLKATLNGPGPFTVFAPSDAAFAKLPAGTVESLLMPENKAKLAAILSYHVVPGRLPSAALAGLTATPATVQGRTLGIDTSLGIKVGGAIVTSPDIAAANGVIHVIDTVLMPPAN